MPEIYASADDFGDFKSSINKGRESYITNISDPNMLFDFASYNALFTLSALNQRELEDTPGLLTSKPHDIIVRSGGIGPDENTSNVPLRAADKKILDGNERLQGAVEKSRKVLGRNRDLYFRNVTMTSIPGLNDKRRLSSVTNINMEIVEPAGVTLLERIRGAAVNNGYLDHLDAPYLLTIDFKGFDESGQLVSDKQSNTMRRKIPVKLVNMQLDLNQSGTVYQVTAIPYNEFAFVNTYNYPRTAGALYPKGKKIKDVFVTLESLLNKQTQDEKDQGLIELADTYRIVIDPDLKPTQETVIETLGQTGMLAQKFEGPPGTPPQEYMRIGPGFAITKVLEEIMKGHPDFSEKEFKKFKKKCETRLGLAQFKGGATGVAKAVQSKEYYFDYFKIRSSIIPQEGEFDKIRATNRKKITYYVEPYKIHAYSLALTGVSTGDNFRDFVFKTYNYIFTGENVDILDLNINYKVAYFQSRLKDFEATDKKKILVDDVNVKNTGSTTSKVFFSDGSFITKSEPGLAKSEGTGKTGGTPTQLDAFLDSLTHPLADMVNIQMEVLGDPAWISQSQFIPVSGAFSTGEGIFKDENIDIWRGNRGRIWNDKLRCYNTDVAEPIILLNFRMPTDLNDKTGLYELQSDQSAEFTGLYRVISVEHNFTDGKYTNVLQLTRFNNQGMPVSNPVPTVNVTSKDGRQTQVTSRESYINSIAQGISAGKFSNIPAIQRKLRKEVDKLKSNVKSRIKNKLKGFY